MSRARRGPVPVDPTTRCRSGEHLRTPENTGTAKTGRRYCKPCAKAKDAERRARGPSPMKSKPADVVLTPFEVEGLLALVPCMDCGAVPTRRGVGEDGKPRWLDAPVTSHGTGCAVGAQREIVQRNRSKSKGVAA